MTVGAEVARLKRDLESLEEEVAVSTGPRAKSPLTSAERRSLKAAIQEMIQTLDELSSKVGG